MLVNDLKNVSLLLSFVFCLKTADMKYMAIEILKDNIEKKEELEELEKNKEIKEYIILDKLEMFDLYDEWIKEYEKHISVNYCDSLKKKYNEFVNKKK